MKTISNGLFALIIATGLVVSPTVFAQSSADNVGAIQPAATPQVPQPADGGVNWKGVGVGAGTLASNIFYVPAKLAYGILGGLGGGAAYALTGGNKQVADTIWRSSLGGDYVVTPDMIQGKERLHFNGPTATSPSDDQTGSIAGSGVSVAPSYAAATPPTAVSSSTVPASGGSAASRPIDRGAGPVDGASNTSKKNSAPLPDTSVE